MANKPNSLLQLTAPRPAASSRNLLWKQTELAAKGSSADREPSQFSCLNHSKCFEKIKDHFGSSAISIDELDGVSMSFDTWRFNLRKSNTEPLVRLNVETRGDYVLLQEKTNELKLLISQL